MAVSEGINSKSLTVHVASGIKWKEYEGKKVSSLRFGLNKTRLVVRWNDTREYGTILEQANLERDGINAVMRALADEGYAPR